MQKYSYLTEKNHKWHIKMKTATRSLITRICESELSVQFNSVVQSCPTLCDPINSNMPGFPVYHQLPELTQTHSTESVMPFNHPILLSPSPLAFNFSQHQGFSCESFFASGDRSIWVSASESKLYYYYFFFWSLNNFLIFLLLIYFFSW